MAIEFWNNFFILLSFVAVRVLILILDRLNFILAGGYLVSVPLSLRVLIYDLNRGRMQEIIVKKTLFLRYWIIIQWRCALFATNPNYWHTIKFFFYILFVLANRYASCFHLSSFLYIWIPCCTNSIFLFKLRFTFRRR